MNTRLIILVCLAIIGIAFVWYFFSNRGSQNTQQTQTTPTLPVAGQNSNSDPGIVTVPSQGLSVATTDGGPVITQNFLKDPGTVADPNNAGYYSLRATTDSSSAYLVTYIAKTQYFNVELLKEPIGQSRLLAEQRLLQLLGLPTKDLCRLSYTVSAPSSVSSQYGGVSLKFSFCPGAVVLPK